MTRKCLKAAVDEIDCITSRISSLLNVLDKR